MELELERFREKRRLDPENCTRKGHSSATTGVGVVKQQEAETAQQKQCEDVRPR